MRLTLLGASWGDSCVCCGEPSMLAVQPRLACDSLDRFASLSRARRRRTAKLSRRTKM